MMPRLHQSSSALSLFFIFWAIQLLLLLLFVPLSSFLLINWQQSVSARQQQLKTMLFSSFSSFFCISKTFLPSSIGTKGIHLHRRCGIDWGLERGNHLSNCSVWHCSICKRWQATGRGINWQSINIITQNRQLISWIGSTCLQEEEEEEVDSCGRFWADGHTQRRRSILAFLCQSSSVRT